MTEDDLAFLPLKVTHIDRGGRRVFDPEDKRRLIEACRRPGVSVSGMALKAGVNANQLRKWIGARTPVNEAALDGPDREETSPSRFVPVVAVGDTASVFSRAPAASLAPDRREGSRVSLCSAPSARLSATLPNGVMVELECSGQDGSLVTAMIAALGAH
ncbi:IS66-like element accessory protein TnpA [Burkholderia ubonensis]|uniref:IS66-like element accessory protein TnpA n=1 Tax=Burkholderia ubonensis TaxID=101571 RepID=UPI0009B43CA8|nr:transposase [Burkholderia ubonensis]